MTTLPAPDRATRRSRWSPVEWSIRAKLVVVLLVPGVLAAVLGGLRISDQTSYASDAERVARYVSAQNEVARLVENLQQERFKAIQFVATGRTADPSMMNPSRADVDSAAAVVRSAVEGLEADGASRGDTFLGDVDRQAQQALAQLPALRAVVPQPTIPTSELIARYTELITQLIQLDSALIRGISSADSSRLSAGLNSLSAARNEATAQLAIITTASAGLEPPATVLAGLPASDARLEAAFQNLRLDLDGLQRARYTGLVGGPTNTARRQLVATLTGPDAQPVGIAPNATSTYDGFLAELDATESAMRNELTATTERRRQQAVDAATVESVRLIVALVVSSMLVGLIARALVTSLSRLRRSALDIAHRQLPDAVARMRSGRPPEPGPRSMAITNREETGDVARAFDAVHTQAVRLATEQVSFQQEVNRMITDLSRRSQVLVDRQLQLIEGLEQDERDPDQLSFLFRIDHLATRMRRNNENLLVLAGTGQATTNARPIALLEVLQAAVSEIEQYQRVVVRQPPGVRLVGHAAGDVQHLLAELLDNATAYSPPQTQVLLAAERTATGAVVIRIHDRGLGIPDDQLEVVNAQLRTGSRPTFTTARRLGLFVVGQLGTRHGITVALAGPSGSEAREGTVATVTVPGPLIVVDPDRSPPVAPQVPAPRGAPPEVAPGGRHRSPREPAPARADHQPSHAGHSGGRAPDPEPATEWFPVVGAPIERSAR